MQSGVGYLTDLVSKLGVPGEVVSKALGDKMTKCVFL
jgi:hypothetical protein